MWMHTDREPDRRPQRSHPDRTRRLRLVGGVEHAQRPIHPGASGAFDDRLEVVLEYFIREMTMRVDHVVWARVLQPNPSGFGRSKG